MLHNSRFLFSFLKTDRKIVVLFLLVIFCFSLILTPTRNARAVVPTNPLTILVQVINSSVQVTAHNLGFQNKNFLLNPAAAITRLVIRTLRDMVIQWIATGQFGMPQFTASYFADPSRWAENAARMFLSQLTGINFCNYNLNVPKTFSFNIRLSFDFKCNFNNYQNTLSSFIKNPSATGMATQWLLENSDPIHDIFLLAERKHEQEVRARNARNNEAQAGGGFLGQRDPVTGKIMTPGKVIADMLQESVGSNWRECDSSQEFQTILASCTLSALADIADSAFGKIADGFLGKAFSGP